MSEKFNTQGSVQACEFFHHVLSGFDEACRRLDSVVEKVYEIAGKIIRFRFAGPSLIARTVPALAHHLEIKQTVEPGLTICLWDSISSTVPAPEFPWSDRSGSGGNGFCEQSYKMWTYHDQQVRLVIQPDMEANHISLSILDMTQNLAVFWVPDMTKIPYYETGSPLRAILHWWFGMHGIQMIHAGAVGTEAGGILIAGKSNSGKSTTVLACLSSGLCYLSDDYALIRTDPVPFAFTLYNAAKLNPDNLHRFPELSALIVNRNRLEKEKALIFLYPAWAGACPHQFPIKAVVTPKVSGLKKTTLQRISPATSLRALAPSTLFQLNGATHEAFHRMTNLVTSVPNYVLHVGTDLSGIAPQVRDVLEQEGQQDSTRDGETSVHTCDE